MVVRERRVRVHASIPASQADALKALADASGVPLARAVHYAVERLLEVARREGALAVAGGLVPAVQGATGGDSVAEVAEALDLRVPDPGQEPSAPAHRNGVPAPGPGADGERDRIADPPAEQFSVPESAQPGVQGGAHDAAQPGARGSDRESVQGTDPAAASSVAPAGDAAPAPPG